MDSKFGHNNYFVIMGFMGKGGLNLKGVELMVYALIYGFSQTENQIFTGSQSYIADAINSSREVINRALRSLIEKDLIEKIDNEINGVKLPNYRVNIKKSQDVIKSHTPRDEKSHNNIDNNIDSIIYNKYNNKYITTTTDKLSSKSSKYISSNTNLNNYLSMSEELNIPNKLHETLKDWFEYKDGRKPKKNNHYDEIGMKKILTQIQNKVKEFGVDLVCEAIDNTIINQWQGILWKYCEENMNKKKTSKRIWDEECQCYFDENGKMIME